MAPDKVMTLALRYYADRTRRGQWNQPSPEREQIMALTDQLQSFQQRRNQKNNKGKKKGNGGKKGDNKKKGKKRNEPKWKSTPPEDGESTTKKVNNKTFHWCANHEKWVAHTTDECKGIGTTDGKHDNQAKNKGGKPKNNLPSLRTTNFSFRKL